MSFIRTEVFSVCLKRNVSLTVILPDDAITGVGVQPPYKTLYMLHGYSGEGMVLATYLSLRKHSELKGIAIVLPDGYNSFYIDHPERDENYSRFIGEELVAITRRMFPLSDKREDTFIGGISMGGYGSLYNGAKYHETFSKVMAMSPAVDGYDLLEKHQEGTAGFAPGVFANVYGEADKYYESEYYLQYLYGELGAKAPQVWLTCGTEDELVYPVVKKFSEDLDGMGISHVHRFLPGKHELEYWENELDSGFSFLAGIPEGSRNRLIMEIL